MRRFLFLFCLAALLAAASDLVISDVTVIDGTGAPPRRMTVFVANGKIAKPAGGARRPVRIDGRGKYLVPGLWDMHVHLRNESDLDGWLKHGVTSIRDMGSELERTTALRTAIEKGTRVGPRIYTCGPAVEGSGPEVTFPVVRAPGPRESFDAVERLDSGQVDFIKVLSNLTRDAYDALAQRARVLRLPFAGHIPKGMKLDDVIEARQRSIEHLDVLPDEIGSQTARRMQLYNVWVTPTIAADQRRPELVPKLARLGVGLLAGSNRGEPDGIHRELESLVAAGLTPMQALQAATINAASFFRLEDTEGTIRPGRVADLVLLEADPLADIRNTRRISAVIARGKVVHRTATKPQSSAAKNRKRRS